MNHHHTRILEHFSPLQRTSLQRWLTQSSAGRRNYHGAFMKGLREMSAGLRQDALDRRTKIAFTLLNEFGTRLSPRTVLFTLTDAVEERMSRSLVPMR